MLKSKKVGKAYVMLSCWLGAGLCPLHEVFDNDLNSFEQNQTDFMYKFNEQIKCTILFKILKIVPFVACNIGSYSAT